MSEFITLHTPSGTGQILYIGRDHINTVEPYGSNGGSSINGNIRVMESPEAVLEAVRKAMADIIT